MLFRPTCLVLKRDIEEKLSSTTKELENYGEGLPDDDRERQNYLINVSI